MKKKYLLTILVMLLICSSVIAGGNNETTTTDPVIEQNSEFTYENLRKMSEARSYEGAPAEGMKLAFGNLLLAIPLCQVVQDGIIEEWKLAGGDPDDLLILDNKVDGQIALQNAEIVFNSGIKAFIQFQADMQINAMIARRARDAGVFMIGIDIPVPGFPFMGVDNYGVSQISGQYLIDNMENIYGSWDEVDLVVINWHPASGENVTWRTKGAADLLSEEYGSTAVLDGEGSKVKSVNATGTTESGQSSIMDVLAAHPDAENIIVFTLNDPEASGVIEGAKLAGRWDSAKWTVLSAGNDDIGKELVAAGEIDGDVDFHFENYARYCVPAAIAYLHGNPVPSHLFVDMDLATR